MSNAKITSRTAALLRSKQMIWVVLGALLIGIVAFAGSYAYEKKQTELDATRLATKTPETKSMGDLAMPGESGLWRTQSEERLRAITDKALQDSAKTEKAEKELESIRKELDALKAAKSEFKPNTATTPTPAGKMPPGTPNQANMANADQSLFVQKGSQLFPVPKGGLEVAPGIYGLGGPIGQQPAAANASLNGYGNANGVSGIGPFAQANAPMQQPFGGLQQNNVNQQLMPPQQSGLGATQPANAEQPAPPAPPEPPRITIVKINKALSQVSDKDKAQSANAANATTTGGGKTADALIPTERIKQAVRLRDERVADDDPMAANRTGQRGVESYIPTGSFVRVTLLNGIDAPTGGQSQQNPHPVLMRVADDAELPNDMRAEFKGCFITGNGHGDISAERAYIRLDRFSCVDQEGGVIDVPIRGYISGEDGKTGLRGKLVEKTGSVLANALLAAVAQGIGSAFSLGAQTQTTTPLGGTTTAVTNPIRAGIGNGVSRAGDMLAQYYIKLAEQLHPVIEIGGARTVDAVITRGFTIDRTNSKNAKVAAND